MCVENRMLRSPLLTTPRNSSMSSSRDTGSSPLVGSSRMSRRASCESASASMYFTRMPDESCETFFVSSSANSCR